ncbi:restriction endonuclease subunit S [Acinetobacter towneri]|uniref:restriction endonuclease subunit S n=1 Tax=Acinetobacter towneri TaxID=202956 RepID=UPI001F29FA05|nr:restriction endonuclease subunit S [Acinetobacter towneri]UIP26550.1 restriction endonuclease subunit S [Acinetobacter towneri]
MAVPKLRFKEFNDSWDLKKLDHIAEVNPKTKELPASFFYIDLESVSEGLLIQRKKIDINEAPSRAQRLLEKSDVLFQMVRPYQQNNFYFDLDGDYVASTGYAQIRTKLNSKYIYYVLHSKKFLDEVINRCTGTSYPAINSSELSSIEVAFPSIREQTKIASFLSAVDEKISQLMQKYQLLSQYKQGMMQKLFSQQLRFKADDGSEFGEWENKTLGEVGENIIGLTYSPTDVTNDSTGILVLRSSNIKEGRLDKSDQVRVNKKIQDKIIVQPNDILICTRNGSQRLIGKSVIINDDEIMTFGAFMSVYRSKYNRFIAYLMQTPWFFEQVQMNLGARINQITTGTLNEFTFDFPCLEEQTKIANFLSAIDQKIEVVAQQIEQAKTWKKGLLQQMFV